jgi:GT2 family glycosyltransferase
MMSRAEVFQSVGGFDEKNLKVAYNDVDYCLKLREKGLLIVWTPYATMFHYESLSRGYDFSNQEKDYVHQRWNTLMQNDPYYNPNLSMDLADFSIAKTPRSLRRK